MTAPSSRERLHWLASAWGVEPGYHDIWGCRREISDAGLRALLGALGVAATTDEEVDRGLAQAHPRYWQRLAEPVVVLEAPGSVLEVPVRVPRLGADDRIAWRLEPESGGPLEGAADVEALRLCERSTVDGAPHELRMLTIETALVPGYHRLALRVAAAEARVLVIAAPARCYEPPALAGAARAWGWAAQLYGLRSSRNWGVGDFGDLLALVDAAAAHGAHAIGLNPLHARFPGDARRVSPYAPSSRQWLDVLAIDIEAVKDFDEADDVRARVRAPAFAARLQHLRDAALVDFDGVSRAKHEVLRGLYAHFRSAHLARDTPRAQAFRAFQARGGAPLRRHALCEALQAHFQAQDPSIRDWTGWPEAWRDPAGEAVARFAAQATGRIEYYEYLQWQADDQLARAAARCRERGMAIGLYLDLAVSADRGGSDCWSYRDQHAASASIGAPPDDFNLSGQDWGLPPPIPAAMREAGHEPFALALRANMRHAGALRIDHVMGLMRLYWIPRGAGARDGCYVRYPLDELMAIVALESHRNRCLVIGEDLGTVPGEVRAALARARLLSCRLLYFERDATGGFTPPAAYPRDALVSIGTHDLPTLAGWWLGSDLRLRRALGLSDDDAARLAQARAHDRLRLLEALARDGRLPAGTDPAAAAQAALTPALVEAVHAWLASSPARLMMVQPEDCLGVTEQNNLPGTVDEHPNWRRKLPVTVEELAAGTAAARLARALAAERGGPRAVAVSRHPTRAPPA
jgi:(1->4)-alpha-D-glucan 1-alpha-D-glucosylmutase